MLPKKKKKNYLTSYNFKYKKTVLNIKIGTIVF